MENVDTEAKMHAYISKQPGICGGRSVMLGTRMPVWSIIKWYKLGLSIEDIIREFPQLTPAQVHAAFSCYYDNQEEVENDITENEAETSLRKMI